MSDIPIPLNVGAPTLAETINKIAALREAGLFVSCPGKVTAFDAATGMAAVKPLIQDWSADENGTRVFEAIPIVNNVPLHFPGAGKMRLTFPVQVNDVGLLVFGDRSFDEWIAATSSDPAPADVRRHALSDASFFPGVNPGGWTIDPVNGTIGFEGGPQIQFNAESIALDNGALAVARMTDAVDPGTTMETWIGAVTVYVNGIAPGTLIPPVDFGLISEGAPRVTA